MKAYGTSKKLLNIKIEPNLDGSMKNNVVKAPQQEPYDKKIIANLSIKYNIFRRLILLMKLDIQTYYNLRMLILNSTQLTYYGFVKLA